LERRGLLKQEDIRNSWQRIFDMNFGDYRHWGTKETRQIQACLPYIRMRDVQEVDFFVAR